MSTYDTLKNGELDKVSDWGYGFIIPARLMEGEMVGNEGSSWNVFLGQGVGCRLIDNWGDSYSVHQAKIPEETILKIPKMDSDLKGMNKNSLPIYIRMDIKQRVGGATNIDKQIYYQINPRFGKSIEYLLSANQSGVIKEVAHAENQKYVGQHLSIGELFNTLYDGYHWGFDYKQSTMGKTLETAYNIRHHDQRTNQPSEPLKHFIDSNYMKVN